MSDLSGALRAAAEEADKMQEENNSRFDHLESCTNYLCDENGRLREKLKKTANLLRQFADVLSED